MEPISTIATVAGLVQTSLALEKQLNERIDTAAGHMALNRAAQFADNRKPRVSEFFQRFTGYMRVQPSGTLGRSFGTEVF